MNILAEIPLGQHFSRYNANLIGMTSCAEISTKVLAITKLRGVLLIDFCTTTGTSIALPFNDLASTINYTKYQPTNNHKEKFFRNVTNIGGGWGVNMIWGRGGAHSDVPRRRVDLPSHDSSGSSLMRRESGIGNIYDIESFKNRTHVNGSHFAGVNLLAEEHHVLRPTTRFLTPLVAGCLWIVGVMRSLRFRLTSINVLGLAAA